MCAEGGVESVLRETEAESAPAQSASRCNREAKVRQNVASMMFVELFFWKNQRESEDVREEYNWQVHFPYNTSTKIPMYKSQA